MHSLTLQDWGTIAAIVFGTLAGIWSIFQYLANRKFPKVTYEVEEISMFNMPSSLLASILHSPAKLSIRSSGRILAENVKVRISTTRKIESVVANPPTPLNREDLAIAIDRDKMNPTESIELSIVCEGAPTASQFRAIAITHSQGEAVRVAPNTPKIIRFEIGPFSFAYDTFAGALKSVGFSFLRGTFD